MANKVDTQHKLYKDLETKRDVFRAVKGGTDTIQSFGKIYLPKFPAEKESEYNARLKASTIDGLVMGGVDTLTGSVFYGDIDTSAVNPSILPLLDNIDNKGNSFEVFAREAFENAFEGVSVIVIDRPKTDIPVVSLEDQQVLNIRTYWRMYTAHDVINWRYRVNPISKATELELIVLSEPTEVVDPKDRFTVTTIQKYRIYFLDAANIVNWELWRKADGVQADQFVREDGGVLPEYSAIPVSLVGCLDDDPRLLVESRLEIKAYQKESSFDVIEYLSIPVFYTIGYEDKKPIPFGANTHVRIASGQGNGVGFAQIDSAGHDSLKGTISGIKDFIKGRLSELTTAAVNAPIKTATQTVVEDKDKQARLIVWAEQLESALNEAIGITAESMGMPKDQGGEIVLNTKWAASQAAAEQMRTNLAGQANDPNMPPGMQQKGNMPGNMPPASKMMN